MLRHLPPDVQLRAMPADVDVTQLLIAADQGDEQAVERLLPLVYDELRQIAHRHLYGHQVQTLCTTDVVHEAYVKLFDKSSLPADSRAHFFGAAARAMRQVIVDYARKRNALKRGGNQKPVDLEGIDIALDMQAEEILALNEALERLAHFDERLARMVECRFFGGLSVEETALVLDVSARTVKRDWRRARAWLYRELSSDV